jgi:hypothetical protein
MMVSGIHLRDVGSVLPNSRKSLNNSIQTGRAVVTSITALEFLPIHRGRRRVTLPDLSNIDIHLLTYADSDVLWRYNTT